LDQRVGRVKPRKGTEQGWTKHGQPLPPLPCTARLANRVSRRCACALTRMHVHAHAHRTPHTARSRAAADSPHVLLDAVQFRARARVCARTRMSTHASALTDTFRPPQMGHFSLDTLLLLLQEARLLTRVRKGSAVATRHRRCGRGVGGWLGMTTSTRGLPADVQSPCAVCP